LRPGEAKPTYTDLRPGLSTAPAGNGRRERIDVPFALEDRPDEKPLAIMNGGLNDDLNESQA
jgi:hypothetical protein